VVLYGEGLPDDAVLGAIQALSDADVLVVGGTSLVVYPAAGFLDYFHGQTRAIINLSATGFDSSADIVVNAPIAATLAAAVKSI
jgi:NAD-dependent deacetylase